MAGADGRLVIVAVVLLQTHSALTLANVRLETRALHIVQPNLIAAWQTRVHT